MPHDDNNRLARGFGQGYEYVGVGFQLAAVILVFGGLGWLLDGRLHTRPVFAIVGFLVGTVGWFVSLYYRVQKDTTGGKGDKGEKRGRGGRSAGGA